MRHSQSGIVQGQHAFTKFVFSYFAATSWQASFGAFVVFDLDKAFPIRCRVFPEKHVRGKKPKRLRRLQDDSVAEVVEGEECTLCLRYNSMLSLDAVSANELFVVEQPWLSVVSTFPEALQRKVYGT
jgi:hypothetical protein